MGHATTIRDNLRELEQAAQRLTQLPRDEDAPPAAFRHFRAQQLLHEGMDLDVLQAYLGHADISTTRRIYAPYTAVDKVRDQLETFGQSAKDAANDGN